MFVGNLGRPGVTSGHYPEKQWTEPGWVERTWNGLQKRLGPQATEPPAAARQFVRRVTRAGAVLDCLPHNNLKAEIKTVRSLLHRRGLHVEGMAHSVALVRELAARILGARPADEQILSAWGLLAGRAVESEDTDKTVTLSLAAATAALAGIPVHVITVNDYLVRRDAERLRPLYRALGLSVSHVIAGTDLPGRKISYQADITYVSHKQIAFDYLRDRLVSEGRRGRLQLQLDRLNENSERGRNLLLRGLCFALIDEADAVLIDDARQPLVISRNTDNPGSRQVYEKALELARKLNPGTDYEIDERASRVRLTSSGQIRVGLMTEDLGGMWTGPARSQDLILQALTALQLFVRDRNYTVQNEKILVDDEAAKRMNISPAWQRGILQLLEMKEDLPHAGDRETLTRISYQELFHRYLRLGAISRTLCESRYELEKMYPLKVMKVAPRYRPKRRRGPTRLFPTARQKWEALADRIADLRKVGRPVIVGVGSIPAAELLSSILERRKLPHRVLTGSPMEDEEEYLQRAGESGMITLMGIQAGRGISIPLRPVEAKEDGLAVILAEAGDARRHDRQFIQRCGTAETQGDFEYFFSLEDDVVRLFAPRWAVGGVRRFGWTGSWVIRAFLRLTQRAAERHHAKLCLRLLDMDKQTNKVLAFSGRPD